MRVGSDQVNDRYSGMVFLWLRKVVSKEILRVTKPIGSVARPFPLLPGFH